jgi:hypothetical protein
MFLQHKVNRKRQERSDTKNMGSADLDVVNARVGRAIGVRDVDAQQPEVRNRYLFFYQCEREMGRFESDR